MSGSFSPLFAASPAEGLCTIIYHWVFVLIDTLAATVFKLTLIQTRPVAFLPQSHDLPPSRDAQRLHACTTHARIKHYKD